MTSTIKRKLATFDLLRRFGTLSQYTAKLSFSTQGSMDSLPSSVEAEHHGRLRSSVAADGTPPVYHVEHVHLSKKDRHFVPDSVDTQASDTAEVPSDTREEPANVQRPEPIYNTPRVHREPDERFPAASYMAGKPLQARLRSESHGSPPDVHWRDMQHHHSHEHAQHDVSESEVSTHMSALYGILLTVCSFCLSISATLTHNIENSYARWFDSAMMAVGILWLLFAFVYLFRQPGQRIDGISVLETEEARLKKQKFIRSEVDSGSFYLKMGATLFAMGSLIYACLQLGVFVENLACFNIVFGVNPCLFTVFVVLQLYFIFKNSQFKITKYRHISRFGLAHLVATDICLWMRILVDETLEEFEEIDRGGNRTTEPAVETINTPVYHLGVLGYHPICIGEPSAMEELNEQADIFLFPCIIEYMLICAGVVFIMWQMVGSADNAHFKPSLVLRNPRVFSIDCTHAANGLFAGILVIVLTIIGLIMFFLFNKHSGEDDNQMMLGAYTGNIMDIALNILGIFSVAYCGYIFGKKLHIVNVHTANMALDDGLLILTMTGVYGFAVVCILGALETNSVDNLLDMVGATLEIIQSTMQTAFLLDAGKRMVFQPGASKHHTSGKHQDYANIDKPAREMVMFLLANNFAQWSLNVLLTLRADAAPGPRKFYGARQWTILLHTTVPLVIFYRFHSTVCLFDIWKRAYKIRRNSTVDVQNTEQDVQRQPRRFSYFSVTDGDQAAE